MLLMPLPYVHHLLMPLPYVHRLLMPRPYVHRLFGLMPLDLQYHASLCFLKGGLGMRLRF